MKLEKILVVDDEASIRGVLHDLLERSGMSVLGVATLAQASEVLQKDSFDLILCDLRLSDGNGLDFIRTVKQQLPQQKFALITGFASTDSVIDALRLGVSDYLIKPIAPSMLQAMMSRLQQLWKLEQENSVLRTQLSETTEQEIFWGNSPAMQTVRELIAKAAPTDTTVLITGESGSGKEVIAQMIHTQSTRSTQAMIRVNCAAIPASLMESEFFGHEKGAFTGAVQRRQGRFELASGGTLFLDEVSEIPLELQAKLLRVLQEKEFERVGGQKTIQTDVRLVAASNRNLQQFVKEGKFREDLFYRLNVFPIPAPSLRERGEDVLRLAEFFLKRFAKRYGKKHLQLSEYAQQEIQNYSWTGNVRELQNVIERAVILNEKTIPSLNLLGGTSSQLSPSLSSGQSIPSIAELEQKAILQALESLNGNRTHTARALGISLRTLRNKLQAYRKAGIAVPTAVD